MTEQSAEHAQEPAAQQAAAAADSVAAALRQLYLAGLGVPATVAEGAGWLFETLVKHGESIEPQSKEFVKALGEKVGGAVGTSARQAQSTLRDLGERVRAATSRSEPAGGEPPAAIPTRQELEALAARVEALAAQIEELRGKATEELT